MDRQPRRLGLLTGLLCILLLLGAQQPARAQNRTAPNEPLPSSPWRIDTTENSVTLRWQPDPSGRTPQSRWPLVEINGLQLPAQLFAFAATGPTAPRLRIDSLTSQPTDRREAPVAPITAAIPQTLDGSPRPDLTAANNSALPDTPVTLLRRGRMRGVELLVVAVTQRFAHNGQPHTLTSLTFSMDGALPLDALSTPAALTAQPLTLDTVSTPSPLASQPRVRVEVQSAGMQEIRLDDLRALGLEDELAHSSLRFGLGRFNTEEDVDHVVGAVVEAVNRLRAMSPQYEMARQGVGPAP